MSSFLQSISKRNFFVFIVVFTVFFCIFLVVTSSRIVDSGLLASFFETG